MMPINRSIAAFLAATIACSFAGSALADTPWQKHHPRRAEVNHRLQRQNHRIHEERKEGEISAAQARGLHAEDRSVRKEERMMAEQHDGHITKQEQRQLNGQLNGISKQIGQ